MEVFYNRVRANVCRTARKTVCLALFLFILPAIIFAAPSPIIFDGNEWIIQDENDPGFIGFNASGLTLDIRRFVQLPDPPPRVNMLAHAPDDDRLFVPTEEGNIYAVSPDGSTLTELFNLGEALLMRNGGESALKPGFQGQGGLRSIAFHPDFNDATKAGYRKLYTTQVVLRPADISGLTYIGSPTPTLVDDSNLDRNDSLLAEWTAMVDDNGRIMGVDANSFREVFRVAVVSNEHPIKQLAFNPYATPIDPDAPPSDPDTPPSDPDYGLVYILHGDGDRSFMTSTGQDPSTATGKVLRINPLQDGDNTYSIPATNPFVGDDSVLDEIYTLGHRNPHAIAFALDALGKPQIFVAEVGYGSVEEVNLIQAGGDYGWGLREGTFVRFSSRMVRPLPADEGVNGFIFPVAQYGHGNREQPHAIAGGFAIENGSELNGYYFFGDFTRHTTPLLTFPLAAVENATLQGNPAELNPVEIMTVVMTFDHDDDPATPSIFVDSFQDITRAEPNNNSTRTDLRFGQGPNGELYLMSKRSGWIYLVTNSVRP